MNYRHIIHLFLSIMIICVSISGCKSAPPPVTNKTNAMIGSGTTKYLLQKAAKEAVKLWDEALEAQQMAAQAQRLNKLDDMLIYQRNALKAAGQAQQKADEVLSLQQKLDDFARLQVAADVENAQKAAQEAQAIAASINRLRLAIYQQKVKDISTRIIDSIPGELKDAAEEGLTEIFCDVLSKKLAGTPPARELTKWRVEVHLITAVSDPKVVSAWVTDSMFAEAEYLADSLQWQDEVDGYKDACDTIVDLP